MTTQTKTGQEWEEKIEEVLRNRILDIGYEYRGVKREEGIQVYSGSPLQLIDELCVVIRTLLEQTRQQLFSQVDKVVEEKIKYIDEFHLTGEDTGYNKALQDLKYRIAELKEKQSE